MARAVLPSYQEAISPDWLGIVAPWVSMSDYANLCRVSMKFYDQFAPRLWNDPLAAINEINVSIPGKGEIITPRAIKKPALEAEPGVGHQAEGFSAPCTGLTKPFDRHKLVH
jgi:hypothetical protein